MASTSGTVYGNNVDGSEGFYISWQLVSQNAANKTSVINWQLGWRFSSTECRGLRNGEGYVNGSTVYYNHNSGDGVHSYNSSHNHKPQLQISSGQITIAHNSDGTKSFNLSGTMTGYSGLVSSGNGWFDLPSLAQAPPAPGAPFFDTITSTSVRAMYNGNGDGGSPVTDWQLAYGTDPNQFQTLLSGGAYGGTWTVTGLTPGTTYYFWGRGVNAVGYGNWSARSQVTTLRVPDAPSAPTISNLKQLSLTASFKANGNGGASITGYQIGYGTSSSSPTTIISATSPQAVTGLKPGTKYYFWARAQNSVGWSAWSAVTVVTTIAGARVNVGGVWKNAVPYVNVNGTWKVARPWSRIAGVWKESS